MVKFQVPLELRVTRCLCYSQILTTLKILFIVHQWCIWVATNSRLAHVREWTDSIERAVLRSVKRPSSCRHFCNYLFAPGEHTAVSYFERKWVVLKLKATRQPRVFAAPPESFTSLVARAARSPHPEIHRLSAPVGALGNGGGGTRDAWRVGVRSAERQLFYWWVFAADWRQQLRSQHHSTGRERLCSASGGATSTASLAARPALPKAKYCCANCSRTIATDKRAAALLDMPPVPAPRHRAPVSRAPSAAQPVHVASRATYGAHTVHFYELQGSTIALFWKCGIVFRRIYCL